MMREDQAPEILVGRDLPGCRYETFRMERRAGGVQGQQLILRNDQSRVGNALRELPWPTPQHIRIDVGSQWPKLPLPRRDVVD